MAKKVKRSRKAKPSLADDIFASLNEALKYARGEKADVIVHRVWQEQQLIALESGKVSHARF